MFEYYSDEINGENFIRKIARGLAYVKKKQYFCSRKSFWTFNRQVFGHLIDKNMSFWTLN